MMVGCILTVNTPINDTPSDTLISSLLTRRAPDREPYERKTVCTHQPEEDNESHPTRDYDGADRRAMAAGVGDNHAEQ